MKIRMTRKKYPDGTVMIKIYVGRCLESTMFEKDGVLHNDVGPAVIYKNPHSQQLVKEFWLNGKEYFDDLEWMVAVGNLEEE